MMPVQRLNAAERTYLLSLARQSIVSYVNKGPLPKIDKENLSDVLRYDGASFVTLTIKGFLRGCVGALEPYQSLVEDVQEHAIAAAFQDYRFPPLRAEEVNEILIEISALTHPFELKYDNPDELITKLRPGVDGVVIIDGRRRATFLPQVWEKIPAPEEFLGQLCMKMGATPDLWRTKKLEVLTYQVEEFHE